MNNRTCTGCEKIFTPTHGRQRCCSIECRKPNHAKVTKSCDWCGASCVKYQGRQRYSRTYCGTQCRDAAIRMDGDGSCEIPSDHWARWYGATSQWPPVVNDSWRHLRSSLRAAIEDGDHASTLTAIKAKTSTTSSGCWEWQGITKGGYPVARIGSRDVAVHRAALEASMGAPLGKQAAHHRCANSRCVNPAHLQPVTHAENAAEMLARTYLVSRVRDLESALSSLAPGHPLLTEVGIKGIA